jgi:hypothetical protein
MGLFEFVLVNEYFSDVTLPIQVIKFNNWTYSLDEILLKDGYTRQIIIKHFLARMCNCFLLLFFVAMGKLLCMKVDICLKKIVCLFCMQLDYIINKYNLLRNKSERENHFPSSNKKLCMLIEMKHENYI